MSEVEKKDYEYTTLMNMLHVSVSKHLLDEHFTLVWANPFYYDLIGYTREEYERLYQNLCDRYYAGDPEEWRRIGAVVTKTMEEGKKAYSISSRMRRKSGEYIWVRMAATFVDEYIDGHQVAYTVMTDINDIMQMKIEQSVTYDNLPGFVGKYRVQSGPRFTLLAANDRYVDFFGEGCWREMEDPLYRDNFVRNQEIFKAHERSFLAGEPAHFIVKMKEHHGKEAFLQVNASCVDWQDGDPVYLAIFIDVTDETELRQMQKRLEEQAVQLKEALASAERANRAKTDFLSHMSHDIRTPMNAIIGMTDIARAHIEEPEKLRDCLRKISLSSQHLLGLINDVLDMSRIESGKMIINSGVMSLPELLRNVVAIMQPNIKARGQQFSIHLRRVKHEWVFSDSLRLRQIFINILSNASKFTPSGGNISICVEEASDGTPGQARFRFIFTDTGKGMRPEFIRHLFEPFSREQDSRVDKTEGSGLGMAITQKLVALLDGEIEVRSEVGKGTTFLVTLPMRIEQAPYSPGRLPDLRILVVDDDDVMCEHMMQTLGEIGVRVESANNGEGALALLEEVRRKGGAFDAVLLDWKMPGMDGPQTARRIRQAYGEQLPILIVSAYDVADIEGEALASGVNGFITKPLFVSTLCEALRRYVLGERAETEEEARAGAQEFAGRRILLVEDNDLNRDIAVELLGSAGAQIQCACDGAQGCEAFRVSPVGYYDLILMDVQMPTMNGYEATRRIRQMARADAETVPVVAMTADAFSEDIVKAREAGMNGHLAKPLDAQTLKREIRKILS